jgi:O-antigen/teichoic acid export membrane protein
LIDARRKDEVLGSIPIPSRARRLFSGWSASLFQMALGITQQVALVPVFLHFWSGEILAAWLVIYAIGNLVLIADGGLQFRSINRFLGFKSGIDCDGRTAHFYAALLRVYLGLGGLLAVLVLAGALLVSPSTAFRFQAIADFDAAFVVMAAGMLLTLPSGLVTGLYRARGLYGRAVWLQSWATLAGQIGQLIAIVVTGSLLAVTIVYVATQLLIAIYLLAIDAPRRFPFLRRARVRQPCLRQPCLRQPWLRHHWRWVVGQFRKGVPFGIAGATELALLNLPVLLVSALVSDRVAVAQWGLTRVVAGLLRGLCVQATLPLAAELGHDHAVGANEQLRNLYARGSVFVALLASVVVSGLLPFWEDFFALWTRGAIPYDPMLAMTLLIGTAAIAPAILALSYASYSNRGDLLVRAKGLQLAVFLVLSLLLIPPLGPLGAAIAIVVSDLGVQFGVLALVIIRQTLQHPLRHILFVAAMMIATTLTGWGLGLAIRSAIPWSGPARFAAECALWLVVVALAASPLAIGRIREKLIAAIPR